MAVAFVRAHTTGTVTSSGSTVSATLAAAVPAGNLLVAQVVNDNSSSTSPIAVLSKPANETATWVELKEVPSSDPTASGGVVTTLAVIRTTVSWASGTSITATLVTSLANQTAVSVPKKVFLLGEFSGATTSLRSTATSNQATNGTAATTIGATTAGDLLLVAVGSEDSTAPVIVTGVAGAFSTAASVATTGQAAAGVAARLGYQIPSADISTSPSVSTTFVGDGGVAVAALQAVPATPVSASMSPASTDLSANTVVITPVTAAMSAAGDLSAGVIARWTVTSALDAAGDLSASSASVWPVTALLDAGGELSATASISVPVFPVSADLTATGALDSTVAVVLQVLAELAATASLDAMVSSFPSVYPAFFVTADLTVETQDIDPASKTLTLTLDDGFPELLDTPAYLDVLVGNGESNEVVDFALIGGSTTTALDQPITLTEFGSSTASVLIPALNQGVYALRALGATSSDSTDLTFLVLVDSLSELVDGDDTAAVPTPPVVSTGSGSWRLVDTTTGEERYWQFIRNPARWTNPLQPKFLEHAVTTAPDGNVLAWEAADRAWQFEFTGYLDTQAEYVELQYWAELRRRFWLVDHRDRVHFVTFEFFDARPRIVPTKPWAHDYTIRAIHFFSQDVGEPV